MRLPCKFEVTFYQVIWSQLGSLWLCKSGFDFFVLWPRGSICFLNFTQFDICIMGVKGCNLKQREGELIKSFGSKGSEDGQVDDEPVWVWMWMKKVELLLLIFPIIEFKCLIIIDNDWSEDSSEGVSLTNLYNVGFDRGWEYCCFWFWESSDSSDGIWREFLEGRNISFFIWWFSQEWTSFYEVVVDSFWINYDFRF